jgi:hypothetical protein
LLFKFKNHSIKFYLLHFIFIFSRPKTVVSTLEKRSKKSPSPSAPSVTTSNTNTIKAHDDDVKIPEKSSVASDSHSVLANSLDSDEDHLEKLTGASSSTTTSSSIVENSKRVSSFDDGLKPLGILDQIKSSNTSINKLDSDFDNVGNDVSLRYRVEQQRNLNNNQAKLATENKVNICRDY